MVPVIGDRAGGLLEPVRDWTLTPARIAAGYVLLGIGALYVSDVVLPALVGSGPLLAQLQLLTGAVEIALTGGLIFLLTSGSYESLQTTNEHLSVARQELSVLHRILRHNLRNDLTVVAGHAAELESAVETPRLADRCEVIRSSCDELLSSAEKIQLVADIDHDGASTTRVDLAAAFDSAFERLGGAAAPAEMEASIPDGATVAAHEYIEFTFQELLENAIEHGDGGRRTLFVTVRESREHRGWWEILVEDDGPGIPDGELQSLHRREQPLDHGSGVGLWVAGWIVYRSGGTFDIENTDGGTRVTVTLPSPETASQPTAEAVVERFLA